MTQAHSLGFASTCLVPLGSRYLTRKMTFTCTCGAWKATHIEDAPPDSRPERVCVCFDEVSLLERLSDSGPDPRAQADAQDT